jgi:8-hydroxy-5-deazaflavin:NADPH oxidoreductase
MFITVIGVGNVGRALGPRWADLGHVVTYGVRDPEADRHAALLAKTPGGKVESVENAMIGADVAVLAVPWGSAESVARSLEVNPNTVVLDTTNPLLPGFSGLDPQATPSGAELIRRWTGSPRVVKAFSTTGSGNMTSTEYPNATPAMFLAGDDVEAKLIAAELASSIGFDPIDVGGLNAARSLEEVALLWIRLAYVFGHGPDIALALLRRNPAGVGEVEMDTTT